MADTFTIQSAPAVQGAYKSAQGLTAPAVAETPETDGNLTFAEMVREAAGDAISTMQEADAVARSGLAGEASTQEVVEATIALESTVKIAVTMRDKLVEAYQEVLRMPI